MPSRRIKPADAARAVQPSAASGRRWLTWVAGTVGVVAVGLLIWFIARDVGSGPQADLGIPAGVETFAVSNTGHTPDPVDYPQDPPVGGPHDSTPLACGAYDTPVRNENAVHALEHGAVWITYQPDLAASDVSDLDRFARQAEVIVSPYPGLDSPVVLTSWGTQLRLDTVDDAVINQFIGAFKNRTAPEVNAQC